MLSGKELLAFRTKNQAVSDTLPMPDLGVGNSTPQTSVGGPDLFIGNLPKTIIQGTARGAFVAGNILAGAAVGKTPEEVNKYTFTPEGAARVWLGDEEVGLASEGTEILKKIGFSEKSAANVAPGILVALTSLDIFTGGSSKGVINSLKTVDDIAEAGKLLRGAGFTDDVVDQYAPVFANTKTLKETTEAFEAAYKLQTTTRKVETTPLTTLDKSNPITVKGEAFDDVVGSTRKKISDIFKKVGDSDLPTWTAVKTRFTDEAVTPTLRDFNNASVLLRSVGEDVKDIDNAIADIRATIKVEPERFTGVSTKPESTIKVFRGGGDVLPEKVTDIGISVSKDPNVAREFPLSANHQAAFEIGGTVNLDEIPEELWDSISKRAGDIRSEGFREFNIASDAKILNNPDDVPKDVLKTGRDNEFKAINDFARANDFDAVDYDALGVGFLNEKEIRILNPDILKPVAPKLDEVANPVREKLGMLSVNVQERYGKAAVTKAKAEKFQAAEKKVFYELFRYAEEAAYVAEKGGTIGQRVPAWVPEDLRDLVLFDHVLGVLQRGEVPASHASKEMALYTAMVDETAKRAGIKTPAKAAINPEGAILESMRNNTRAPGSEVNSQVKTEITKLDGVRDETPMFEEPDDAMYVADYRSQDEALAAYNQFEAEKYSPKKEFNKKKGKTNASTPYGLNMSALKEVTQFKAGFRDIYRNSERFFGEQWPIIKEKFFDPFDAAKGRMVDEEKALLDSLKTKVVDTWGIKKGSKESAAVMDFGERAIDYDELVKRFGTQKAENIKEAALWFRGEYDRMIDEINVVESKLYPNAPHKITPKRKDYFRHFEEMSEGWTGFVNAFEDPTLGNLPPGFKTEDSKGAKSKWQSFKQERLGWKSKRDAVGGFLNYVPNYVYSKHIDPQTAKFRGLTRDLREATSEGDVSIQNYIEGIESWTDDLAGQANVVDRFAQRIIPGGRRALNVLDFLNKRAKRNAILGNVGASISQAFNVPGAIASAGPINSTRGFVRSIGDVIGYGDRPGIVNESAFIKERYRNSAYDAFNVGMLEHSKEFASWMLGVLDEVGTKFAWNAHYEKAIKDGIANPMKYADDYTRKSVAGRGIGEVPIVQKSKAFQMVAPFQLEVMNQWYLMREFVDAKDFGKLATLFVAYTIFNEGSEEIKGSKVGFDPLMAVYDSYQIALDDTIQEDGTEVTLGEKATKVGGRLGGEVLSNIPLGSYATIGITTIAGMDEAERQEFFGNADPVRFGQAPLLWNAVKDPLFGILPAWGGAQIEKTVGGIKALASGLVKDKDGNVIMGVEPGASGALQNVLFGQYAPNFEYKESVENEMRSLYLENEMYHENGNDEQVQANLEDLPEHLHSVYRDVAGEEKKKEEGRQVKAMKPTYLIVDALMRENKEEQAKSILMGLDEEEQEIYRTTHSVMTANEEEEMEKEAVIKTAVDYAYAFGTNPIQAFEIVFKNHEIIEDTVGGSFGGVVRMRRIEFKGEEGSDAVKERLMEEEGVPKKEKDNYSLEHVIPLGIGGSNQMENLDLVPKKDHDSWTPVEVYMVNAVKDKKIDYKQAQELILRHKGYQGEPLTFEEIKVIVNNQ